MKKILLLLCLCLATFISAQEVYISTDSITFKNGKAITNFTFSTHKKCSCGISFLTLPTVHLNGQYSYMVLLVNGKPYKNKIMFNQDGWQEVILNKNSLLLNEGNNIISFVSDNNIPSQIRNLRISQSDIDTLKTKKINSEDISALISAMSDPNNPHVLEPKDAPAYRPGVAWDYPIHPVFLLKCFFHQGEDISFLAPSARDPLFGQYQGNIEYRLRFFHEDPSVFYLSKTTSNKFMSFQSGPLPKDGVYYVLIEPKNENEAGWITVRINQNLYKHMFTSSAHKTCIFKNKPEAKIYVQNPQSKFNIFTQNPSIDNSGMVADPIIWILKNDTIVAFNDDYVNQYHENGYGELVPDSLRYDWKQNARIWMKLSDVESYTAQVATSYAYSSLTSTCDFYHSFWSTTESWYEQTGKYYSNIVLEDVIESGLMTVNTSNTKSYNCYAWSVGVDTLVISIKEPTFEWLDKLYNNEPVLCSENSSQTFCRPKNAVKFTRIGATEDNAVIDVWGTEKDGIYKIKHVSIRNDIYQTTNEKKKPHGFDWESKLSAYDSRVFHPRKALKDGESPNEGYGHIIGHYRIAED